MTAAWRPDCGFLEEGFYFFYRHLYANNCLGMQGRVIMGIAPWLGQLRPCHQGDPMFTLHCVYTTFDLPMLEQATLPSCPPALYMRPFSPFPYHFHEGDRIRDHSANPLTGGSPSCRATSSRGRRAERRRARRRPCPLRRRRPRPRTRQRRGTGRAGSGSGGC